MAQSLQLSVVPSGTINLVDSSVINAVKVSSNNLRVNYLNEDNGSIQEVLVTSSSFVSAIVDSEIITVTRRDLITENIYVNANRVSLIEENDSKAKASINLSNDLGIYLLNETVSELNTLIDAAGGGGGGGAVDSVFGRTGVVTSQNGDYLPAQIGLGNVDNTSDLSKPVSVAQQTALDLKLNTAANIIVEATTSRTLSTSDLVATIDCDNAATTTITIDSDLGVGFNCFVTKNGVGNVTFAAGGGITLNSQGVNLVTRYTGATVIRKSATVVTVYGPLT